MRLVKLYLSFVDNLSLWVGRLVAALVPVLVLVVATEVFSRYALNRPTIWAYDTALFLFAYIALLGGAYALKRDEHIRVDLVYAHVTATRRAVLDLLMAPIAFFFLLLIFIYGGHYAVDALATGARRSTEWAPPVGHYYLLMPIGAGLLLLQLSANCLRAAVLLLHRKEL